MADVEKKIIIDIETNAQQATQKMDGLKGAVSGVDKATGGLLSSLKKLVTNPYIAIIGALVAVFMKLKNAISQSDNAGTAFARLGSSLKTLWQPIERLFIGIAEALGAAANAAADFMKAIMPAKLKEDAERLDDIVVATDKLEDAEREYAVKHAERDAEISKLRTNAAEKDKYTLEERISFLQRAMELEQQDLRERKKIVDEKIRIFRLETANAKSLSDEQKDTLNQLLVEKQNADREYADSQRRLNKAMNPLVDELISKAEDLGTTWKEVAEGIEATYAAQLKVGLQNFLKDSADATQETINQIDKVSKYLDEDSYNKYIDARTKILNGFYKNNAEGAKEAAEAVKSLKGIINPNEFEQTAQSVDMLISQMSGLDEIIAENQKQIDTVTKNAQQKRAEAYKNAQQKITKSEEDVQKTLLSITAATNAERIEQLKEDAAQLQGREKELLDAYIEYYEKINNKQQQIDDLRAKMSVEKNAEVKRAYEEQIAALLESIDSMTALYRNKVSEITTQWVIKENETIAKQLKDSLKQMGDEARDGLQDAIEEANDFEERAADARSRFLKQSLEESQAAERAQLEQFHKEGLLSDEEYYRAKTEMMIKHFGEWTQLSADMLGSFAELSMSIASLYQSEYEKIVNKEGELTEDEKKQAKAALEKQKNATIASIALQQAQAIGYALVAAAGAATVPPTPAAALVYAGTAAAIIASITTGFVQAKQAMSQIDAQIKALDDNTGYATGGYIEGAGTGTSDSIPARLSNGESVINARSTARFYDLLSAINQAGGGVAFPNAMSVPQLNFANGGVAQSYENTYKMIESAVAGIQPVVSVKEITKVQNRLKTKEII